MSYYAPFYQPNYYPQAQQRQDVNPYTQPYQQTIQAPQPPQQNNNGLIWIQGEAGAKSYLVAPGTTVMLMDSEEERFFLKSADASGMPLPLRIFDYKERTNNAQPSVQAPQSGFSFNPDNFITREEFEQRIAAMSHTCKCKEKEENVKNA